MTAYDTQVCAGGLHGLLAVRSRHLGGPMFGEVVYDVCC